MEKITLILLFSNMLFGVVQSAVAEDYTDSETEATHGEGEQKMLIIHEDTGKVTVETLSSEASLQKAQRKVGSVLKEKGDNSIELTESRLELARLELNELMERGDLERYGALISLKQDKVKLLENLLQRKVPSERSKAAAEKSRIEVELLKMELAQEIKDLAQEQREFVLVKKEENKALEGEMRAKNELHEVIRQLSRKIKNLHKKVR